jgi:hypothetical protein
VIGSGNCVVAVGRYLGAGTEVELRYLDEVREA